MEDSVKTAGKTVTPSNPLQESFIKLGEAEQLRQQGKLDRAQRMCEALVRQYPNYVGALHTLGLILADRQNYAQARNVLIEAAMLNPRSWMTLTALSGVYLRLEAPEMAAHTLEQARLIKPKDANVLVTLGEIYREEREYELARDAYSQAIQLEPDLIAAAVGLGLTHSDLGEHAAAAKVLEGVIQRGLHPRDAIHRLAELPTSVVSIDVLAELDKITKEPGEDQAEFDNFMAFVRGMALDKAGRHVEAWDRLIPANRTVFQSLQKRLAEETARQRTSLDILRVHPVRSILVDAEQPISLFVLGPSRSGKTTMEKLVATLPGVKRGYENPSVEIAVRRTFQTASLLTSIRFEQLPSQLYPQCRDNYLEELARRASTARVFTNTLPARIRDAVFLATALPNVRFIFVKRNTEDTILRMFQQRYIWGNAYSYNLNSAREHIRWYHQMMDLLAQKLPDAVRIIQYEDMVADPAAALRTAADLCGLPMTEAPLPAIGDDRGCAEPYRQLMAAALEG